ncbi:MAG: hypothetical protein ABIO39_04740 [Caulobacteraceae bacterium]
MSQNETSRTVVVFFGAIVMAVGLLIALVSGGCTLVLGWITAAEALKALQGSSGPTIGSAAQGLLITFGIGAIPFTFGAIAAIAGWRMIRRRPVTEDSRKL